MRLGIHCHDITDSIRSARTETIKQRKKRHLPRRCALASESYSFQYLEALDDQSEAVINPIIHQQIKTERKADERIVRRRLGIYSANTFTHEYSESNEQNSPVNKRYLQRRCGMVSKHNSDQYSDELDDQRMDVVDQIDDRRYGTSTIENGGNKQSRLKEKIRRQYVIPSPIDVIIEGRVCDGNIGIKRYVLALYIDHYRGAVSRSERTIIACAVLGSIEARGGRCLKESRSKEGMYYEVDELYTMKKVKAVFKKSNTIAKHATYITD